MTAPYVEKTEQVPLGASFSWLFNIEVTWRRVGRFWFSAIVACAERFKVISHPSLFEIKQSYLPFLSGMVAKSF